MDNGRQTVGERRSRLDAPAHAAEPAHRSGRGPEPHVAPRGLSVVFSSRTVLRVVLPAVALLSAASLLGQVLAHGAGLDGGLVDVYVQLTDVDRERSLPTWFQAMVLLACSAALWTVADDVRRTAGSGRRHRYWRLLAAAFAYLSIDEFVGLHELASIPIRTELELGGALRFAWVLVAVPLLLVFAAVLLPFLRSLPRPTLVGFAVSGLLYVGGAVGLELVGGVLTESVGMDTLAYSAEATAEELLEMLGMTLFLATVARHRERYVAA